ncbi:Aldo/keto reductase [Pterulicium gracile]|uniref:Aldo/keto reductase n=1 Tax=Pterulicium gracile TaxID=1884261 RepID=A0A5C3QMK4_9AGAR|nr:Aldo/keto reductase [Pterula gracilis]
MNTLRLHSGASIPWIGYGSGTAHYGKDCAAITLTALQSGFTHLDGAQAYENEPSLGEALSKFTQASTSSDRKKLFITTKLEAVSKAKGQTVESKLRESLQKLGLDYVDLYLVHNPKQHAEAGIVQVWKEMIKVKELGLTKSIGVSNFNKSQIKELLDAGLEAPTVNQIEYHPFVAQTLQPLLDFQAKHNILTQSYGGLTPLIASRFEKVTDAAVKEKREALEKLVDSIAGKNKMTTSQALLKWLKAQGIIAITTSTKEERIKEYLATDSLPDLSAEEVKEITNVTGGIQHRTFDFVPHMDTQ